MPYVLIFKGYCKDELIIKERHHFSSPKDLRAYASWLISFAMSSGGCDRYDIRVNRTEVDNTPLAA